MEGFIKPCDAVVELIYECPKCSARHRLTRKDTKYPGIVTCYCRHRFKVRPVSQIKITPLYRDINRKNFGKRVTLDLDQAQNALVALGYKKTEISKKFAGLLEKNDYNSVDDLIKDFILGEEMKNGKQNHV